MNILSLEHVPFEGPVQIEDWAVARGHRLAHMAVYAGQKFPDPDSVDFLLIMGGPMGATEDFRYPWMKPEKQFISQVMLKRKKVLGICLGAQMLANILGARVFANHSREIGWYSIELDPPNIRNSPLSALDQHMFVFHWHGDTFMLPDGATHLARSKACENQAFAYGKTIIGLQFHLEVTLAQIQLLTDLCANDMVAVSQYVQSAPEMFGLSESLIPPMHNALSRFLDAFTAPAVDEAK